MRFWTYIENESKRAPKELALVSPVASGLKSWSGGRRFESRRRPMVMKVAFYCIFTVFSITQGPFFLKGLRPSPDRADRPTESVGNLGRQTSVGG